MVTIIHNPSVKSTCCCLLDDVTENSLIKYFSFQHVTEGSKLPTWADRQGYNVLGRDALSLWEAFWAGYAISGQGSCQPHGEHHATSQARFGFLLLAMCHPCFDSWRAPINPTTKEEGVEGFFTAPFAMDSYSLSWHLAPLHPCPHSSNSVPRRKCLSVPAVPHRQLTHRDQLTACTYWPYTEIWESCAGSMTAPVCQYGPVCCHFPLFFF